ncbi:2-oxoglutarate-dependent dioxygenase 19-like [Prosopis cineraria]|uniref:2-oxoglutarate-dependent dioxygenase 19-like n=1 Tax=Prosopis cineraria TaxID=364024 RepID=UPI00240F45F6|nr:2-oxoglutarate-dependent dioxygenase 19-like [Prosopis cineraria]
MASSVVTISSSKPQELQASHISSVKAFIESNNAISIPSTYYSITELREDVVEDDLAASIPVINFALLTSDDPHIHANTVQDLGNVCKEWGFFMIINHGISKKLMKDLLNMSMEFHNLSFEEKKELANEELITPIRYGTSALPHGEKVHYWRDYLKVETHPNFNFPHKPPGFSELAFEYSRKIREVLRILLQGVSESLRLQPNAIIEYTDYDSSYQTCQVNLYPPCPQPDLVLALPPHNDNGLMTLLIQNDINGLQVMHDGKWVNVNPLPNCIIVNIGDQLESMTNGRYKSIRHRAVANERHTRVTFALGNGPSLENETGPAPELLEKEQPIYKTIKYKDYFEVQHEARIANKRGLDIIRINN